MAITLDQVYYTYSPGTPFARLALQGVSLTVDKGDFIALIGHTGSGKSTLIQQLGGLLQPSQGQAAIDGVDLAGKPKATKGVRGQVGIVFQYPEHQLFAETAYDDVAFGPRNLGRSPAEVDRLVRQALAWVGLDFDTYAQRSPFRLSGGQMRRLAVAGVIAMEPAYLILDEPSAGLDPRSRRALFEEVLKLHRQRGLAIILVTHNMDEAARYAKRLLVLSGGRLLFDGPPKEVFTQHQQELEAMGLAVPTAARLGAVLRARGLAVPPDLTTEAELEAFLLRWAKGRGKKRC